MSKETLSYNKWLGLKLTDPDRSAKYLNFALSDSSEMFKKGLRKVAEAHQMSKVAKEAEVAREALYRMLSESGNPTLNTLNGILRAVGLKLLVAPIKGKVSSGEGARIGTVSTTSKTKTKRDHVSDVGTMGYFHKSTAGIQGAAGVRRADTDSIGYLNSERRGPQKAEYSKAS